MTKERRLGRGLEALLGRPLDAPGPQISRVQASSDEAAAAGLMNISVYEIDRNPFQPRRDFDEAEIDQLADSIQEHGLIQPVVVRRVGERYQLVAGERRLRAAIKAGWPDLPAQVKDVDDRQAAELAIVENLQRKDLNPLEKAASFQQYLERYQCTQEELARRLQIDRSTVANLIRLLELPNDVQTAVRAGAISQGHARALLPLGDEREQLSFCQRIQDEGLSVRATEALVGDMIQAADAEPLRLVTEDGGRRPPRKARNQHLAALEQELRAALGTKVDLRQTSQGRGKFVIHFKTHDEFQRLHDLLCAGGGRSQSNVG